MKKNDNIVIATDSISKDWGLPMTATLADYCGKFENVTLADLAKATGGNVTVMRGKAKEPVIGEIYDPEKVNYAAVSDYLYKRNPNLKLGALDWGAMNEVKVPVSRELILNYETGSRYYIKRLNGEFYVIATTSTHVALMPLNDGDTTIRAYHKDTFKAYSPKYLGNLLDEDTETA